jgi:hypothetical protein
MIRRRLVLAAAVVAGLGVAVPVSAAVVNEQTFKLTPSSKKPKASSGITFSTDRKNYTVPAPPAKPVTVQRTVFMLPAGSKIDVTAASACSLSVLAKQGAAGCPGKSIGSGKAIIVTNVPVLPSIEEDVAMFATKTGMAAQLTGLQTLTLPVKVAGRKITVDVPRLCLPGGTPANNCATGEAVLKSLNVKIKAKTKGSGSKSKRLITTPANCVGGKWTSRAGYAYSNGDVETQTSTSTCQK